MVYLIAGATHTGKTSLADRLMRQIGVPYVSIDHVKMGLIRSGETTLRAEDSEQALTAYLRPILREMIKTVIENDQHLILEGVYIPASYKDDFATRYLEQIRYVCLVQSDAYIREHFAEILTHANTIERRMFPAGLTPERLIEMNQRNRAASEANGVNFHVIEKYPLPLSLFTDSAG